MTILKLFANLYLVAMLYIELSLPEGLSANWTQWGDWSICYVSNGFGKMNRSRLCNTTNYFTSCLGNSSEIVNCNASCSDLKSVFVLQETQFTSSNVVATLNNIHKEFMVTFEAMPTSYVKMWTSVIHLTKKENNNNYGDRIPAVFFTPSGNGFIEVSSAINGISDSYITFGKLPLMQWSTIKISQELVNGSYIYSIHLNATKVFSILNKQPVNLPNVSVYVSDPWYTPQPGFIRNLVILTGAYGIYEEWSSWSSCNISCGKGFKNRTRTYCKTGFSNDFTFEFGECFSNDHCEVEWAQWNDWSMCYVTNGNGHMNRTRKCSAKNNFEWCYGSSTDMAYCDKCCPELRKQWNMSFYGYFEGNQLSINFKINQTSEMIGYLNVAFEYFLPPYFTVTSESTLVDFVKFDAKHLMYTFPGNFTLSNSFVHKISGAFNNTYCPLPGILSSYIFIKLTFQSKTGKRWKLFKGFQTTTQCAIVQKVNVDKEKEVRQESYGRGVYWDAKNACIYLCMNQHVKRSKSACYFSNDAGNLWKDLDISVGSVLGHHSLTKDLYAVHRNKKTFMIFHTVQKKWISINDQQFKDRASSYIDPDSRRSLEGDDDQVYSLGPYQWKGNSEGLFYRKAETDSWIPRAKGIAYVRQLETEITDTLKVVHKQWFQKK